MRPIELTEQERDRSARLLDMSQYPKIQTLWRRESEKPHNMIVGEYARPEFEYLSTVPWIATEKVDGTNIRVIWDGHDVRFAGRTDRADTPPFLLERLYERFGGEANEQMFEQIFGEEPAVLYGEGYGARIQKGGGNYNPDGVDFVLFDVFINGIWLEHSAVTGNERDTVCSIGEKLDCPVVPIVARGTPREISDLVCEGLTSFWGDFIPEGVIMKPAVTLLTHDGSRIISKLKHKDFVEVSES